MQENVLLVINNKKIDRVYCGIITRELTLESIKTTHWPTETHIEFLTFVSDDIRNFYEGREWEREKKILQR